MARARRALAIPQKLCCQSVSDRRDHDALVAALADPLAAPGRRLKALQVVAEQACRLLLELPELAAVQVLVVPRELAEVLAAGRQVLVVPVLGLQRVLAVAQEQRVLVALELGLQQVQAVEQLVLVAPGQQAVVLAALGQAGSVGGRCRLHCHLNQNRVLSAQLCTQLSVQT